MFVTKFTTAKFFEFSKFIANNLRCPKITLTTEIVLMIATKFII